MQVNLPINLLRTFVTIVDTGSMARASEHIFLTQSALSLQMKRLADMLQKPIFVRRQGTTSLTPTGEVLLSCAREILALNDQIITSIGARSAEPARIGMVQDFADAILSGTLARFKQLNPDIQLAIRVNNSAELKELIASDGLDVAVYLSDTNDETSIQTAEMVWLGDVHLLAEPALPIAIMTKACLFRDAALEALDASGRPYSIVLETPSISVLRAAVDGGLAITCRTHAFLNRRFEPLDVLERPLPKISYCIDVKPSAPPVVESLASLLGMALAKPSCFVPAYGR